MTPNLQFTTPANLPLLPLRDVVVFPHMVIPLFVGRPKSIIALENAMASGKQILLVAQKSAAKDEPVFEDLYEVGTVASILQMLKLPDGTVKVLVEGAQRVRVTEFIDEQTYFAGHAVPIEENIELGSELEALRRALIAQFDNYVKLNKKIPPEILASLAGIDDAGRMADTIAAHLPLKLEQKQAILEIFELKGRLDHLMGFLETEIDILQVEKRIRGRVKRQMEKSQREYYLNEQVKAIQKELGEIEEGAELDELDKRIKTAHMSKEAIKKAEAELKKLRMMSPMSAEATVVRTYIDTLVSLPWKKKTKISKDLVKAEEILEEDHYGLEKVKERIVEYLAVQQRVDKLKGPILCLVGPPGVGKTSLGQSIARATNRKFIRMALGGVRDEAEIRGHRRTYIGSLPGKILQSMAKVGVRNPMFLLDEVDKLGQDFRGDPSSALLEVLDPEQNHTFQDHYIEVEYDLSDVMFVATANNLNIPAPLLDRMEVIRLAGYTEDEKVNIAIRYLLPKQMKNNGLAEGEMAISEAALRDIVRYYSREAGVRSLEREIAKICRKAVTAHTLKKTRGKINVTPKNLDKYLGVRRYTYGLAELNNQVGQVTGLAWTEVGGELLTIEASIMPGKGVIIRTGQLGDVMKESIEAARTVMRSRSRQLGIKSEIFEKNDLHIHLPEGATPKDGPSAGIALTTAMVSVFTGIPVRCDVAMTGEITLRGEVLPIGGLKEKLLAAHRGGIKTVLIPEGNVKDLVDMPDNIKNRLDIKPVKWIEQVFDYALESSPEPLAEEIQEAVAPVTKAQDAAAVIKH
ncbi:MAG: endopeptidase La [Hydrogenophilales bacterium CG03_land_8_20_14_0_80_62_28]|nr:endopeptidase La [Betaproteobacteria bacterium]OIO78517.1 MAG: endopeptidase La [Hydrogenophilaceae bacterium CG1_02_62_390]PIV24228.1 MAG: endopeptidase La [Hydrogenophilales bacterium CG03_land_8_20_14_0_80_62_28]PIW39264.1 MAG: endopeptidase La [Hydrogenophilales bacterium CG15_BIG_FIL_POST_REV_8_21_14_020_62_31]PIW72423.1 MAG: endopeptidase La [Hydrogenophilales bacterium CG12_big_fil_rev_8_21_14_0_65_61_21]PIX02262.1 MAG: endopeptidase La [Hydrogenophilales bacterium CG_4_8_14_3_um_fil